MVLALALLIVSARARLHKGRRQVFGINFHSVNDPLYISRQS
jgi:hypothetical protein